MPQRSSDLILKLIVLSLKCALKLNVLVDLLNLLHNVAHLCRTYVVLALVTIDKLQVHDGWLVVSLRLDDLPLELKAWLNVLRLKAKEHSIHIVGDVEAIYVRWVHLDVHVVDIHHPVAFE